jgi:hypothetical protein
MHRRSYRCLPLVAGIALVLLAAGPSLAGGLPRAHHGASVAPQPLLQPQASLVTTYHNDLYRSGQYVVAQLTFKTANASAANLHRQRERRGLRAAAVLSRA